MHIAKASSDRPWPLGQTEVIVQKNRAESGFAECSQSHAVFLRRRTVQGGSRVGSGIRCGAKPPVGRRGEWKGSVLGPQRIARMSQGHVDNVDAKARPF